MRFLINPGPRSRRRRAGRVIIVKPASLDTGRRRRKVRSSVSHRSVSDPARNRPTTKKGIPMAKRARKRGKGGRFLSAASGTRRRRRRVRRNPVAANPPRRRRRRSAVTVARRRQSTSVARVTRRRRRRVGFRRNPPNIRGIVGGVFEGIKTGSAVVVGQTIARKVRGAVQGMLPASINVSTGLGQVGVSLAAAVGTTVAVGFLPSSFRRFGPFIVAGAFSETINAALAQTPIAPYLSAFPNRRVVRVGPGANGAQGRAVAAANGGRVSAWPRALAGNLSAYPRNAGMPMNAGV